MIRVYDETGNGDQAAGLRVVAGGGTILHGSGYHNASYQMGVRHDGVYHSRDENADRGGQQRQLFIRAHDETFDCGAGRAVTQSKLGSDRVFYVVPIDEKA